MGYHPNGTWKRLVGTEHCTFRPILGSPFCHQEYEEWRRGVSIPCGPVCKYWVDPGGLAFLSVSECRPGQWIDALRFLPKEAGEYLVNPSCNKSYFWILHYSPVGSDYRYRNRRIESAYGRPCFYYVGGKDYDRIVVHEVSYWMPIPPLPESGAADA